MNILLLSPNSSETGGIQRYTIDIVRAIHTNQYKLHHVELLCSSLVGKIRFSIASFFSVLRVRPNVIICMHINLSPLCYVLSKVFRIPYLVITHGTDVWNIKNGIRVYSMKNATRIVSVSSYTMNVLVEQFPSIARKISLLPCSVDGEKFYHQVKSKEIIRLHSLNGQKIIFTLARLTSNDQYKGYEHVLNIMPSLIEQVPNALYIIGGEGDYVPKLKSIIKRLKLEQHVVLTGFIPESNLIEYYNLADVFVMPSKQEGFGIVFLEALACGTPVITGARDGSQDAVLQGKVGLMVDPNNQEDLLKAVVSILNRSAPERLIDPNYIRKTTLEHYGFDVFKDNFVELIRSTTR